MLRVLLVTFRRYIPLWLAGAVLGALTTQVTIWIYAPAVPSLWRVLLIVTVVGVLVGLAPHVVRRRR